MCPASLTLILGLCGSGKSYTLDRLDAEVKSPHDGFALNHNGEIEYVIEALRAGRSCAVVEIAYCERGARASFLTWVRREVPAVEIRFICFENDVQKANANCVRRDDGRDLQRLFAINKHFSASY